jgi:hypothetical protein
MSSDWMWSLPRPVPGQVTCQPRPRVPLHPGRAPVVLEEDRIALAAHDAREDVVQRALPQRSPLRAGRIGCVRVRAAHGTAPQRDETRSNLRTTLSPGAPTLRSRRRP